jgi:hypothetical protein
VARRKRLIIVLDNYELVDRVDVWIRQIMRSAGPRLIWILSDRNDLLQSRCSGMSISTAMLTTFPGGCYPTPCARSPWTTYAAILPLPYPSAR